MGKSTEIKPTLPRRKRKVSEEAINNRKSKTSSLPSIKEKPVMDQTPNQVQIEERPDEGNSADVAPSGSSLLCNIDQFTASLLTSAREEIESSSAFVSNDSTDVTGLASNLDGDLDALVHGKDNSSASKDNPRIKLSKQMSVEEKMRLLFEDSSEDESPATAEKEKMEELPISYSPAKTSKVSPVIRNSLPPKPKISLKSLSSLSWNSLWPNDVDMNQRKGLEKIDRLIIDCEKISKQEQTKIDDCVKKCYNEVDDVVRKCLKKFLTLGSITQTVHDILSKEFAKEFQDTIVERYLIKHPNLLGFELTREDKGDIVDKIILYFNIQDVVNSELKTIPSNPATQLPEVCQKLTREFYCKLLTNSLGKKQKAILLSDDFKLQIRALIRHKSSSSVNTKDNIIITTLP